MGRRGDRKGRHRPVRPKLAGRTVGAWTWIPRRLVREQLRVARLGRSHTLRRVARYRSRPPGGLVHPGLGPRGVGVAEQTPSLLDRDRNFLSGFLAILRALGAGEVLTVVGQRQAWGGDRSVASVVRIHPRRGSLTVASAVQEMACHTADRSQVRRDRMRCRNSVAAAGLLGASRMYAPSVCSSATSRRSVQPGQSRMS